MSIRPVDMQAMVHRTFELDKSAQDRSGEMNASNRNLHSDFEKETRKLTDKVIEKTKNEKKISNKKKKDPHSKNKDKKKKKRGNSSISLDISV